MKSSRSQLLTLRILALLSFGFAVAGAMPGAWHQLFLSGAAISSGVLVGQLLFWTRSVEAVEPTVAAEQNQFNLNA